MEGTTPRLGRQREWSHGSSHRQWKRLASTYRVEVFKTNDNSVIDWHNDTITFDMIQSFHVLIRLTQIRLVVAGIFKKIILNFILFKLI